jgi:hypothetical protein
MSRDDPYRITQRAVLRWCSIAARRNAPGNVREHHMKKFVALYTAPVAAMDEIRRTRSPERMKEFNDSWMKWVKSHEKSFVDVGSPTGKNKRVSKDAIQDVKNEVLGYSVVQAETHEEAAKIFQDSPNLQIPGAYIEVLEYVEMPER